MKVTAGGLFPQKKGKLKHWMNMTKTPMTPNQLTWRSAVSVTYNLMNLSNYFVVWRFTKMVLSDKTNR